MTTYEKYRGVKNKVSFSSVVTDSLCYKLYLLLSPVKYKIMGLQSAKLLISKYQKQELYQVEAKESNTRWLYKIKLQEATDTLSITAYDTHH